MLVNHIRLCFVVFDWSLAFFLNAAFTDNFFVILHHPLDNILTVELEIFNFFVSEKLEILRIFREIKSFHKPYSHAIKAGVWEVVSTPYIHTLVYHPEICAWEFDKVRYLLICHFFIKSRHEVTATSLYASYMRTILNHLNYLRKQSFLNCLNYAPIVRLHCLL